MPGLRVCAHCGDTVMGSYREWGVEAVEREMSTCPDGTGMVHTIAAAWCCSWECLALKAASMVEAGASRRVTGERF